MDRRATLSVLSGKSSKSKTTSAPFLRGTLSPYSGPWTVKEAGHLLRRTTFGPDQHSVDNVVAMGLDAAIDQLFSSAKVKPAPPIKWVLDSPHRLFPNDIPFVIDPEVEYGEPWVNAKIIPNTGNGQQDAGIVNYRLLSMYAWVFEMMNKNELTIRDKMAIFWHNHFVVAEFRLPHMIYQYMSTIYEYGVGDFRQLTKDMVIDPSMLLYLNGNENTAAAPNENFARELLELFTIGKGDLAGPGDYTNYTEDDIRAMARALTGWQINQLSILGNKIEVNFRGNRHDDGDKQLSHRFNNAVINGNGQNEYKDVVDLIFEQDEVSRFICRKLYRYFVHYDITPEIEMDVIEPMAQILRDSDYVIEPALRALLRSEHFYGEEAIGCMIKNPADFIVSNIKGLNIQFDGAKTFLTIPDGVVQGPFIDSYNALLMAQMAGDAEMFIYNHPDVAGWKAYYQVPQYYRVWMNTVTLPIRVEQSHTFVNGGEIGIGNNRIRFKSAIPVLEIVGDIPGSEDPNTLIHALADRMFPYGVTEGQKDFLKEVLIPGLPDFEWTVEYSEYLADPNDRQKREAVENRLKALFTSLLEMPEAQLM